MNVVGSAVVPVPIGALPFGWRTSSPVPGGSSNITIEPRTQSGLSARGLRPPRPVGQLRLRRQMLLGPTADLSKRRQERAAGVGERIGDRERGSLPDGAGD